VSAERLYFRQWLAGRDFATDDHVAVGMVNFVYAVGDYETGEAVLVDPAYRPGELVDLVAAEGLSVTGALVTHYHADHVGGNLWGNEIAGLTALLSQVDVPIHVNAHESEWVRRSTGISESAMTTHESGDVLRVGEIDITLIHTPGHTPGSQCFLVDGKLISGDTLFLDGCGRTDLPGSNPEDMYYSLTQRLAQVSNDTTLYPGHRYSAAPSAEMGRVRQENWVFDLSTLESFRATFG